MRTPRTLAAAGLAVAFLGLLLAPMFGWRGVATSGLALARSRDYGLLAFLLLVACLAASAAFSATRRGVLLRLLGAAGLLAAFWAFLGLAFIHAPGLPRPAIGLLATGAGWLLILLSGNPARSRTPVDSR